MELYLLCLMAGESRRMGTLKQFVSLGGKTFFEHIVQRVSAAGIPCAQWIFVGRIGDERGREAVADAGGVWVVNPNPEHGPLSSIRCALSAIPESSGILLWPIDHPLIGDSTLQALLKAATANPESIVVPSFHERRGHPVIFPPWARGFLQAAPLEEGARWVLRQNPQRLLHVAVEDSWVCRNLNTPELLGEAEEFLKAAIPPRAE